MRTASVMPTAAAIATGEARKFIYQYASLYLATFAAVSISPTISDTAITATAPAEYAIPAVAELSGGFTACIDCVLLLL